MCCILITRHRPAVLPCRFLIRRDIHCGYQKFSLLFLLPVRSSLLLPSQAVSPATCTHCPPLISRFPSIEPDFLLYVYNRLAAVVLTYQTKTSFLSGTPGTCVWREPSSILGRVRGYSDWDLLKQRRLIVLSRIPVARTVGQEGFSPLTELSMFFVICPSCWDISLEGPTKASFDNFPRL